MMTTFLSAPLSYQGPTLYDITQLSRLSGGGCGSEGRRPLPDLDSVWVLSRWKSNCFSPTEWSWACWEWVVNMVLSALWDVYLIRFSVRWWSFKKTWYSNSFYDKSFPTEKTCWKCVTLHLKTESDNGLESSGSRPLPYQILTKILHFFIMREQLL